MNQRKDSRPASPMHTDADVRTATTARAQRYPTPSPRDKQPREQNGSYFNPSSTSNVSRSVRTPADTPQTAYSAGSGGGLADQTPVAARFPGATNTGRLPPHQQVIRAIFWDGRSSVLSVEGCRSADEVMLRTIRKAGVAENQLKNHRFFILEGTEANYANCRRLSDNQLMMICTDTSRPERERLMFRNSHAGEPEGPQLMTAAEIAMVQLRDSSAPAAFMSSKKSLAKLQKLTGESLPSLAYPMSPASVARRDMHLQSTAYELEHPEPRAPVAARPRPRKVDSFSGGRPESEHVVADPSFYFPDVNKEDIDKTVRMSIRRSQRLSRANSRLSTTSRLSMASNFSVNSGNNDVPAVPAIPAAFFNSQDGQATPARIRPLSIMGRPGRGQSYRDSMASTAIDAIDEESTFEPNRKSYVSFGADSAPESTTVSMSDNEGNNGGHSYFEDGGSSPPLTDNSLNDQLCQALAEDGEEADEELTDFLKTDSWDNIKYIRGKLIGQGSFGSVYMALHALTAELMAVKQVELPSTAGTAIDTKKNNMVEALKREIALLRELRHQHIVQYLGSSSDANNLNIFLEYVPGGSIAKMLVEYGAMEEQLAGKLVRQILIGLAYLHSKDIIHRDIKGANILVDTHGSVKISDFGISKRVQESKTFLTEGAAGAASGSSSATSTATTGKRGGGGFGNNRVSLQGSVFWMAPEVVKQTAYTRKADIWSLGCLVVEMLTGSHPHPNCTQLQAIFKIGGRGAGGAVNDPSPDVPAKASREAKEFLRSTFRVEQDMRPEAEELLNMGWLRGRS